MRCENWDRQAVFPKEICVDVSVAGVPKTLVAGQPQAIEFMMAARTETPFQKHVFLKGQNKYQKKEEKRTYG